MPDWEIASATYAWQKWEFATTLATWYCISANCVLRSSVLIDPETDPGQGSPNNLSFLLR